jgi:hypothetical protein
MARKLKTYVASLGFYDQAIAAPSMKAALEAWGADSNLFHQGVAKETNDPEVIAATMAQPGVILKRPVGSKEAFGEHSALPVDLGRGGKSEAARKPAARTPVGPRGRRADRAADRMAAIAYEREERRREHESAREAAAQKERKRRQRAIDKAQAAVDEAEREHAEKAAVIETEREAVQKKSQSEDVRWDKVRARLQRALKHARD